MATGYTHDVSTGKVTDFAVFAMNCARAFGALVTMRDDPHDAPIPDEFTPSDYNAKRLETARHDLAALRSMSLDEQRKACEAWYEGELRAYEKRRKERDETCERYRAMREKVAAWSPPTSDHEGLKRFMLQQLDESIRFDCYDPERPKAISTQDWYYREEAQLMRDIAYHKVENEKEIERAKSRTELVRMLRASLVTKES